MLARRGGGSDPLELELEVLVCSVGTKSQTLVLKCS